MPQRKGRPVQGVAPQARSPARRSSFAVVLSSMICLRSIPASSHQSSPDLTVRSMGADSPAAGSLHTNGDGLRVLVYVPG